MRLSINSHGFIADTESQAADDYYPGYMQMMNKIGRERGWQPITRQQYDFARTLRGSDFVGTPDQVIEKILFQHKIFGHHRFLLKLGLSSMDHKKMLRAIELYGTVVAPAVRKAVAERSG